MKVFSLKSVFLLGMLFCTSVFFSCDTAIDPDSDSGDSVLTLYANYGENESIEQHFNSRTVFKLKENPFTRTGYYFIGWAEKPVAPSPMYGNLSEVAFLENTSLYAIWQIETYKIYYQMAYGKRIIENPEEFTVHTGATLNPVREDAKFHFGGWFASADFSGEPVTKIAEGETGDRTFYARWCGLVTYHLDGGYFTDETDLVSEDSGYYTIRADYLLPVPYKPGYQFLGWYDNAALDGDAIFTITDSAAPHISLYAKWEEARYTITYHADGVAAEMLPEQIAELCYGDTVTLAAGDALFSADKKVCVGWGCLRDDEITLYAFGERITVTDSLDLFPLWLISSSVTPPESTLACAGVLYQFDRSLLKRSEQFQIQNIVFSPVEDAPADFDEQSRADAEDSSDEAYFFSVSAFSLEIEE